MIKGLIRASLKQRLLVVLASVVLIGLSFWSALDLNLDAIPDITGPQVQINTSVPALAAAESEQLVTYPHGTSAHGATRAAGNAFADEVWPIPNDAHFQ